MPKGKRRASTGAGDVESRAKRQRKSANRSSAEPLDTSDEFWRALCPGLHVNDAAFKASCLPLRLPDEDVARCRAQLLADGFFTLPPTALEWAVSLKAMRIGVRRLIARGWPASMLLIYDEANPEQLASFCNQCRGPERFKIFPN